MLTNTKVRTAPSNPPVVHAGQSIEDILSSVTTVKDKGIVGSMLLFLDAVRTKTDFSTSVALYDALIGMYGSYDARVAELSNNISNELKGYNSRLADMKAENDAGRIGEDAKANYDREFADITAKVDNLNAIVPRDVVNNDFCVTLARNNAYDHKIDFGVNIQENIGMCEHLKVMYESVGRLTINDAGTLNSINAIFAPNTNNVIIDGIAQMLRNDDTDNNASARFAIKDMEKSAGWLYDLIMAAKKGGKKDVKGYFAEIEGKSAGINGNAIGSYVHKIAAHFPDLRSDENYRRNLSDGVWVKYRLSAVSTAGIIIKHLTDLTKAGVVISDDEHKAIVASYNAPWDIRLSHQIPERVVTATAIWLRANGTEIDGWVQGARAIDSTGSQKVSGLTALFRAYLKKINGLDDLDSKSPKEIKSKITEIA
jgi:hypothetical protein